MAQSYSKQRTSSLEYKSVPDLHLVCRVDPCPVSGRFAGIEAVKQHPSGLRFIHHRALISAQAAVIKHQRTAIIPPQQYWTGFRGVCDFLAFAQTGEELELEESADY